LENGKQVSIDVDAELRIPIDPREVIEALSEAPAQYTFIAYHAERAEQAARRLQDELRNKEGQAYSIYRAAMLEHMGNTFTDSSVHARVNSDATILDIRRQASHAWEAANVLRQVAEGVRHRITSLRAIAAHAANPYA
jgi:tRNA threonylcarbamoyladenosine modification (KEOPS) complex  Pcc1 subunit